MTPQEKSEYNRNWRQQNLEHRREYARQYYRDHAEQYKLYRERSKKKTPKNILWSQGNPLAKACKKCKYLNNNGIPSCDYIIYNGPRPCPGGADCVVKVERGGTAIRKEEFCGD